MMKHKIKNRRSGGFTIIESLIAITIVVLAVTGAFSAAHNGITSALFSRDQITAFYLAQEAIEQIRNLRDQNGLAGVPWMTDIAGAGDPCELGNPCRVDAVNTAAPLASCSGSCTNLLLNNNDFYTYMSGEETKFNREVVLDQNGLATNEVRITATVSWSKGLIDREFKATEILTSWQ